MGATWLARDILHSYVRDVLRETKPGRGETLYLILDETHLSRCGRHVARANWYYDPATRRKDEKMTDAAARMIREFLPPPNVRVMVLFDSYYLCRSVVRALRERGWLFVSQAPENRNVFLGRRKFKAGRRAQQRLRNERGCKAAIGRRRSRFVQEDADMKGLGRVRFGVLASHGPPGTAEGVCQ